ncbi:hypothetical protein GQ600_8242 [Phytophthora cactorum]|nr:hypothetical protein GQ600_8242 [Phytophthora cactorum]
MGMNATDAEAPRAPSSTPGGGRGGQRSGPEGDSIQVDAGASASSDVRTRGVQQQGRRGPRSGGRFGGRRQHGDGNATYVNGVYVPTPDVKVTAQWAKNQIFQAVYSVHQDYESLLEAMKHSERWNWMSRTRKIVSVKDGKSGSGPMPREDRCARYIKLAEVKRPRTRRRHRYFQ